MGTRGAITFVSDGVEKTVYNHFDSYPSGLGVAVMEWVRSEGWDLVSLRAKVSALVMVDSQSQPTAEEWARLARYADTGVSTGRGWYSLLRHTQGSPADILDAGFAGDAKDFPLDSLFCEWAYVVDLDREVFEVYEGFRRGGPSIGRWSEQVAREGYWPVSLVKSWSIAELRASKSTTCSLMDSIERGDESDED